MRIYVTSDTHFDHAKMCEYCDRPDNFNQRIIDNWNKVVKPEDLVIHLGDVCWRGTHMDEVKGRKILVRGNHDKHPMGWYLSRGFDFVCNEFVLKHGGVDMIFTHIPLIFHEHDLNVHGHLHNIANVITPCAAHLISLENNGYNVESLDAIVSSYRSTTDNNY